jgi:hypothetical protein
MEVPIMAKLKLATIVMLPVLAVVGLLWTAMVLAQTNSLIPYGMNAGMQVLNLATRPHPATAPTPPAQADYGPAIGERRLVCEQWNGNQWMRLAVPARQCVQ